MDLDLDLDLALDLDLDLDPGLDQDLDSRTLDRHEVQGLARVQAGVGPGDERVSLFPEHQVAADVAEGGDGDHPEAERGEVGGRGQRLQRRTAGDETRRG